MKKIFYFIEIKSKNNKRKIYSFILNFIKTRKDEKKLKIEYFLDIYL
jgi:hypothetical protein